MRSCSLEALDKFDIQINTQMERLVFEYGLGPKEARVFLRPAEAAEIGVGIPGKIAHINPHYQILMPEFGGTPERAFRQLRNDLNRAAAYEIAVEHPGLGFSWNIEAKGAPRSEERLAELDKQCAELDTVLKGLCGAENREQIAMVAIGITQSAEMDLMPYAIRAGETKLDGAFEFRFAISAAGNGDVKLHLSNLPDSRLSLDWTITIHPDGTHEATVSAVGRNANRSAG